MLGAVDKSWVVTVPAKCGLMKLQYCLVNRLKVAEVIPPSHGFEREPAEGYKRRILFIRDPITRTVSQLRYARQLDVKVARGHVGDIDAFVEFIVSGKSKAYLFTPQATYIEHFKAHKVCRMNEDWPFKEKWWAIYKSCANHETKGPEVKLPKRFAKATREYFESEYAALEAWYQPPTL